jgi:molybdopterin biosynthesis enzyme
MPFDAVSVRGKIAEAIAPVVPGEGVLPAGGDATARMPLRRGGERLRAIDVAVMTAAGLRDMKIRMPRIRLIGGSAGRSTMGDASLDFLSRAVAAAGCRPLDAREEMKSFDAALTEPDADAVIGCGGTGSGRRDTAVQMLAALGRVEAHGIAVSPGETAAFGFVGGRPVLLVPGRLDAALAIWFLIGRYLAARLADGSIEDAQAMLPLKRKVTSTIGLTELMPVACDGGMAEPLAAGYLSFASLTRSGGWMVVPAGSEGYAAGTPVAVRPWP